MQLSDNEEVRDVLVSVNINQFKYANEMMLITDPEGAFVAQDITTGKLLGLCSGINLSPELAYMCIYAVRPEYQGLGIGSALWDKAIEHIGDRNATLYASEPKVIDVYKNRQNFNKIPERRGLIWKGNFVTESLITSIDGISVVDMNDKNIADVIEYDKQVCDGLDRSAQLRALNGQFKTTSLVAINDSNKVMGFCFLWETVSEFQGLGIGSALWDKAIEHIGDRNASLYACEPKVIDVYKNRQNFNKIPERRGLIWKGNFVTNSLITSISGIDLVEMNDKNIADVIEYDKQVCDGLDRSAQLRALNGQFKTTSLVAINDSNKVRGFCFLWEIVSDPYGSFVAQDITTDKLLGVCTSANLSPDLSYICMYAVLKEYQGLGIGTALWDKVIKHTGDRNVSLFVESRKMQDIYYNRCNFRAVPKRRGLLMSGYFMPKGLTASIPGICLVDMNDKNIADVIEYDKHVCNGRDRSVQLRAHIGPFKSVGLVAINDNTHQVVGYCAIWQNISELSYMCIYAVLKEYQGLGVGTTLWDKVIEHMGDRNISLYVDSKKMQENYKTRHNFKADPQRRGLIMKGKPVVNALTDSICGICLVDMNDKNIADVIEYDKQVCDGLDRSAQLRALNGQFKTASLVAINDNNQVMGYCFVWELVSALVNIEVEIELLLRAKTQKPSWSSCIVITFSQ
ncbi:unnamed protein product [Medioppia subpectinata]|uniref:N-acetyltransferase domain-containing protein n=1 Tax=Medioppia subpectinata TaxID=1979941 RepID=A0A7R9PT57_9ACAR|nr:unnamed protein product [Medioppia subpectinata]CAG2100152.1 unnamed protein product [Medioppia subpectinata]